MSDEAVIGQVESSDRFGWCQYGQDTEERRKEAERKEARTAVEVPEDNTVTARSGDFEREVLYTPGGISC